MSARRFRRFASALASLCLTLPAGAAAQESATPVDTVRLRFAWPAGTTAEVATTRYREQVSESTDTVFVSVNYRMNVTMHPEGLLVAYDDFRFPAIADTAQDMDAAALARRASSMVPKFVVAESGDFVRIHDVQSIRAGLDSMLIEMVEPAEVDAMREAMSTMLSEEALTALAAEEWNAVVGMWIDADLELGAVYQFEDQAPLPIIPGAVVPMISEFSAESRTPCIEDGSEADCIELHFVSYPDPDSIGSAITQFLESLPSVPGMESFAFEDLDVENEMVIVTEPGTLRPHRVRITKSVSGVVKAGEERGEVSQIDVRTYRYTYVP